MAGKKYMTVKELHDVCTDLIKDGRGDAIPSIHYIIPRDERVEHDENRWGYLVKCRLPVDSTLVTLVGMDDNEELYGYRS
ncbi:MAG: hypothetical protein IKO41_21335 [Lachnospiraceae bacterium]|nr:hypothetical protein [Lachnospiraceae bacterium]